jgi:methylamine dehydrogenase heavy chain
MRIFYATIAIAVLSWGSPAVADIKAEELSVRALPEVMLPHWVWVNDISFDRMLDGRAYLIDGDRAEMLGMVSGGYGHGTLMLTPDGKKFAVPATFYSRGSRGERTEVVTFYKTKDLRPGKEVLVPPKRFGGIPFLASLATTTDGRFGLIYNFTPEQSVSVVDLASEKYVGEFETPGCGLSYPTGPRNFFLICSDGALQTARLDESGKVTLGPATKKLFSDDDPVTEKGIWTGSRWLFFSISGVVHEIEASSELPRIAHSWRLAGKDLANWIPGSIQTAAFHAGTERLYVLMHEGNRATRKDPGTELWVFDLANHIRLSRIKLVAPATSVAISQDARPLIFTTCFGDTALRIYNESGVQMRKVDGLGPTLTVLQPSPVSQVK